MKKIALSGKKGKGLFALVDDEDFKRVNKYSWHLSRGYPNHKDKQFSAGMHNFIFNGAGIDHINRNKLDNQKHNLRFANQSQNIGNSKSRKGTSIFKGVNWIKRDKLWSAEITFNYKHIHIGKFNKELWAAMAYDIFAKEYFGKFARLNFPIK